MTEKPAQAGGGAGETQRSIGALDPHMLTSLRTIFDLHAGADKKWHKEEITKFLTDIQRHDPSLKSPFAQEEGIEFNDFLSYMTSSHSVITKDPVPTDLSWPLASYFISSSHNTYLSGNQLSSDSTTEAYINVLQRGCRCVEVDVWDGDDSDSDGSSSDDEGVKKAKKSMADKKSKQQEEQKQTKRLSRYGSIKKRLPDSLSQRLEKTALGKRLERRETMKEGASADKDTAKEDTKSGTLETSFEKEKGTPEVAIVEPRVLHGYTLTKEITFRDVCMAIQKSAFAVTDTPLIVSLEVHCNPEQQATMVKIIREVWAEYLIPEPETDATTLPSPNELKKKILIKVKYAPPGTSPDQYDSGEDDRAPADSKKQKKPSKIIQDLSNLGIYTRGVSFKSFTQPEASMPTHIFSLSEKKFLDHHEKKNVELWDHNKNFLMRAYPAGLRITSSNLNPAPFWGAGTQVVALNWQQWDEGMMLNEGMFAGTGGYVLKPEGQYISTPFQSTPSDKHTGYRPEIADKPNKITTKTLSLSLTFIAAQNIPLPEGDKSAKGFEPYIKTELHVDGSEGQRGGHIDNDGHEREGEYKVRTKTHKGCDVNLGNEKLVFKEIPGLVDELTFVRFTVRDDEIGRDALAAWACVRLDRLGEGYRFVHLLDSNGRFTDGVVLVKVEKKLV